jgi:hypothetical protein
MRFVLKRLKWGEYRQQFTRLPGETAVASFATFEEAEDERIRREDEMRNRLNPFNCGGAIQFWTHLDEPRLRDWLLDHDIDPPEPNKTGVTNWAEWWRKNQKKFGPTKRAAVWEVLDKVRFFAVREEPVRTVGYAVIEVHWNYNDEYYDADSEGGRLVKVYRSRERAEAECALRNEEAREGWGDYSSDEEPPAFDPDHDLPAFDMRDRIGHRRGISASELKHGEGLFASSAGVPFFEIIEVELEGLE